MRTKPSLRLRSAIIVAALAVASISTSFAQQTPAQASAVAERVALLHSLADWTNDIVDRLQGRGKTVSGELTRELQAIEGQLARFDRTARQNVEGATVTRADVEEVADRLARVWLDVRALTGPSDQASAAPVATPAPAPAAQQTTTIPGSTNVTVELTTWLSSKTASVGDRFSVLVAAPVYSGGAIAIPSGSVLEGLVTKADAAGRASDAGNLHLFIDRLRGPQGQIADVRGLVVGLGSGEEIKGKGVSPGKTAVGAAVGGLLGGLIDGKKGALIGIGVGAGGTLLAEKGKDVDLPQGTLLAVEIQESFSFSWQWDSR